MNNEPSTTKTGPNSETESTPTRDTSVRRIFDRLRTSGDRIGGTETVVVGSGLVALVTVALGVALAILANLPFDPIVVSSSLRTIVTGGIPVVSSLALVAIAVVAQQTTIRVGVLVAGVFGLLAVVSRAATVPAVVAVTLGGGVVVLGTNGWPMTYRTLRRKIIGGALLAGTAVSLGSSTGLLAGSTRGIGGFLVLGGVTMFAVRSETDRISIVGGVLGFLAVVFVSTTSPYVVGSALLVAFAVAGVPHLLVACAVGGATAATIAGLRRRDYALAVGTPLVLLAGVPATIPRALVVVLGATLVLVDITPLPARDTVREEVSV